MGAAVRLAWRLDVPDTTRLPVEKEMSDTTVVDGDRTALCWGYHSD